ncbi:hypothetical protein OH492_10105 [Vibrio chagasii]|nr:hypothetical protein [Vibrio chagasii]
MVNDWEKNPLFNLADFQQKNRQVVEVSPLAGHLNRGRIAAGRLALKKSKADLGTNLARNDIDI